MRRPLVLLTAAAIAAAPPSRCPPSPRRSPSRSATTTSSRSSGVPTVTVKKNDTVKWNFTGDSPHNVTVKSGPAKFKSKTMSSGSYSKKVTRKGLYTIYCTIHGQGDQSMKLRVK